MKRASVFGFLAASMVGETTAQACCPIELELLGWSRDESKAVVAVAPERRDEDGEFPPMELRLLDVRTGRTLERHEVNPYWYSHCGMRSSPAELRQWIRLAKLAPVPPRRLRNYYSFVDVEGSELYERAERFAILDPDKRETIMQLRGASRPTARDDVPYLLAAPSPSGRRAVVFAGYECDGAPYLPEFITGAQLRRIERAWKESEIGAGYIREWGADPLDEPDLPDRVRSATRTDLVVDPSHALEIRLEGWSRDGTKALLNLRTSSSVAFGGDTENYHLYDTTTGQVIETLSFRRYACSFRSLQDDPTLGETLLRFARIAPKAGGKPRKISRGQAATTRDGRHSVSLGEDGAFRFATGKGLERRKGIAAQPKANPANEDSFVTPGPSRTTPKPTPRSTPERSIAASPNIVCAPTDDVVVLAEDGEAVLQSYPLSLETGERTLVWGGDWGGWYDRRGNWEPFSEIGAPPIAPQCTTVWTGSEMIVWNDEPLGPRGWRYDLVDQVWKRMSEPDVPLFGPAVWTGLEMLVWDAILATGGTYEPTTDAWSLFTRVGAPVAKKKTVLWTGSDLLVLDEETRKAWRYDIAEDQWAPTFVTFSPSCASVAE